MGPILFIFLAVLIISVMPSCGNADEIMPLNVSNSADDLINMGDLLFSEAKYNESIESYDGAIAVLEYEKNSISVRSDDILINLYNVSREYDVRENIYQLNNQKCADLRNPLNVFDRLVPMAIFIYIGIPYKILPKPIGGFIGRTKGVEGTLNNIIIADDIIGGTFNCLKWEAGGRDGYQTKIESLGKNSQDLQAEYNEAQEQYRVTLDQLKNVLNLKCEAFSKLNNENEFNIIRENIIELTKNDESILLHNRGFIFSVNRDYENAIKSFDEAIKIYPQDTDAWFGKGFVLYLQGKFDEAIKAYDEAIKIEPENAMAWNNRGLVLSDQGKYDDALECFETAARIDPGSADIWYNKGGVLEKAQRNSEANAAFGKARELAYAANG
jgi:tetratricopeptide (TPR) repeat protein